MAFGNQNGRKISKGMAKASPQRSKVSKQQPVKPTKSRANNANPRRGGR